jgi:hypothetical protein
MRVFINPAVASLKQHHHLFSGYGCYKGLIDNKYGGLDCKEPADALPTDYIPLLDCFVDKEKVDEAVKGAVVSVKRETKMLWECTHDNRATIPQSFVAP